MSTAIDLNFYFPCANAPFGNGEHRLWNEVNIREIFEFILDINTDANYCIISKDNRRMIFNGYLFKTDSTFDSGITYYIIMNRSTHELYCSQNEKVLWTDGANLLTELNLSPDVYEVISATPTKIKFVQTSIDRIDLNI